MNEELIQLLVAVGGLLGLAIAWKVSAWKRRRRVEAERPSARLMSLFGRVTVTAALIVGVQWIVVVTAADNRGLVLAVLGVPALFAAYSVTNALTVTATDSPRTRGGRR